ncbi:MAG TPA: hypothetical protein VLB68_07685 [Pyrinomonadaceae bacterium]|nr:hypothetical protein [Pyrinomonadaceae bacterium]
MSLTREQASDACGPVIDPSPEGFVILANDRGKLCSLAVGVECAAELDEGPHR